MHKYPTIVTSIFCLRPAQGGADVAPARSASAAPPG